jgi:hypothetical protein
MPMPSSARNKNRNQNVGEKLAMKLHSEYQAIDHQRLLAPDPIGEPARGDGAHEPHPQCQRENRSDCRQRDIKLLRDRQHDQQEDREIERV